MITNKDNIVIYDTDGTTDVFPITFQFWANTDIVAKLRNNTTLVETDLVLTTNFTLSGGNGLVGNLTTTSVYPSGSKLLIQRETSRQQTVDLTSTDDFNAESVEAQLDKTVAMVQEVANASALIVKGSPFDEGDIDFTLPSPSAGKVLQWNATENGLVNSTYNPDEQVALATAQAVIATTQAGNASTSASAAQTAQGLAEDARDEAIEAAGSVPTMASILEAMMPVGFVLTLGVSTNPATLYGFGTWSAIAGRVIVGLDGTQTEFNTLNKTGGAKTHTLTVNEMPEHSHPYTRYASRENGASSLWDTWNGASAANTGTAGGGQAHNNLQPYIVKYVWERTA